MVEKIVLFIHIISVVFMAWPLYALITVNERPKVGAPLGDKVDDFMEGILKKNAIRCYVFQSTALLTGIYLTWSNYGNLALIVSNWRLLGKTVGILLIMGSLSFVVFYLQPKIDKLFADLKNSQGKEDIVKKIGAIRATRKKMAAICLFIVLTVFLLAVQIIIPLPIWANVVLTVLIALFVIRVYKKSVPYGWI
jgi:hypothetical protein